MDYLLIIIVILLATVFLVGVGDRFNLPWPVLLTILTTGIILVPGLPNPEIEPEIILPIFLPPLLWAIGVRVSWGSLRRQWKSVLIYSVLLTAVTAFAVAWAAWAIVPGMSFALALAIGAATAPPDPVAVEAVAEPVGIPRRLVGVLQTEGLFNDAVSLVLFQAAIAAALAGGVINPAELSLSFLTSAVIAVLIGLAVGYLANVFSRMVASSALINAITLIIPFSTYILAEHFHASGVIAVVIAAIHSSSIRQGEFTAEDRFSSHAFWEVVELLMTGLAFGLIGLQAGELVYESDLDLVRVFLEGVVISAVVVLLRLAWMSFFWLLGKVKKNEHATPRTFGEVLVMTWAGMRGMVTLVLALTIPELGGQLRSEAIILVVTVLFFAMVFPGLTLPTLVKVLKISEAGEADDRQEQELLKIAQQAALKSVKRAAQQNTDPEVVAQAQDIFERMAGRIKMAQSESTEYQRRVQEMKKMRSQWQTVRNNSVSAAQQAVLAQRNHYDLDVVNSVLHQLDIMAMAGSSASGGPILMVPALTTGVLKSVDRHKLLHQESTGTSPLPTVEKQSDISATKKHNLD